MVEIFEYAPQPGDRCRQPGCTGTMDTATDCTCTAALAPCPECRGDGLECDKCGARETEPLVGVMS